MAITKEPVIEEGGGAIMAKGDLKESFSFTNCGG